MTDMWARFNELDEPTQERLAGVLETRGADTRDETLKKAGV